MLYFLLVKARPSAKSALGGCFPVVDNSQKRDFKKAARELLEEIKSEGRSSHLLIRSSTLNTAKGKAAQVLLWALSHHLLCNRLENSNHVNLDDLAKALDGVGADVKELEKRLEEEKAREVACLKDLISVTTKDRQDLVAFRLSLRDEDAKIQTELNTLQDLIAREEEELQADLKEAKAGSLEAKAEAMRRSVGSLKNALAKGLEQISLLESEREDNVDSMPVNDASEIPSKIRSWHETSTALSCELTRVMQELKKLPFDLNELKLIAEKVNEVQEDLALRYKKLQECTVKFHVQTANLVHGIKVRSANQSEVSSIRSLTSRKVVPTQVP